MGRISTYYHHYVACIYLLVFFLHKTQQHMCTAHKHKIRPLTDEKKYASNQEMLINTIVILLIRFTFMIAQYADRKPTIRLEQGLLTGFRVNGDRNRIDVFLGIPYASPPIKNLRFTPPQKHYGWNSTLEAINYGPSCPQTPILDNQSEDCLYLNVWAPENWHRYASKPVMIFFEGIDFAKSNKISISGQELAMEDFIVVTVNYRLNVFGFLCLGIPEARGNLGLLDQYLSILWVKENIGKFGGNPEKITLFGYSSGAASAVLHLTSPRTAGLFQRIILSSGSPTSPWHMAKNQFAASRKFATILKCFDDEPKIVLRCMQNKSTFEILKTYQDYLEVGNGDLFLPVVDDFLPETDKYLPYDPIRSLKSGTYVQVAIMTGISDIAIDSQQNKWNKLAGQGLLHLQQYIEHTKIQDIMRRYGFDGDNKEQIMELLKWRYVTANQNTDLLLKQLSQLEFDSKVETPHYVFLNYLESSYIEPIYAYHLEADVDIFVNITDLTLTSDILLLFGPLVLNQIGRRKFNSQESFLSEKLKDAVKNFIIFGNPSPSTNNWKRYMPNEYYVEYFNTNKVNQGDEMLHKNRRISFWTQLLPKMAQTKINYPSTYSKELFTPDSGATFKHAMYTLVGLVIALLVLLAVCIFLLKKNYKERERHLHMIY